MSMNLKVLCKVSAVFQALGEPTRLRILATIGEKGETSVGEIAKAVTTELVNVSHHLGVLRAAGLVDSRKDGRFVLYSVHADWLTKINVTDKGITVEVNG